jgi:hypothetical protein
LNAPQKKAEIAEPLKLLLQSRGGSMFDPPVVASKCVYQGEKPRL